MAAPKKERWVDDLGRSWTVPKAGKRMQFSNAGPAALRAFIFKRDGFSCAKCGWKPKNIPEQYTGHLTIIGDDVNGKRRELQLDHILAMANGGTNHPWNLQTLCFGCNAGKRDRHGR